MTGSPGYARIVVGVDGSAPASAALRWAARRAVDTGAGLVLAHAVDDFGEMGSRFGREAREAGERLLAETAAGVAAEHPALEVETLLLDGGPAWALASAVGARDLLVIGTHKTGYLHGRVLGSRSVQIAVAAPCSVAVIPDVPLRFRRGVVAGIDRVATAASVARAAAGEAGRLGDDLVLVHAASGPEPRGEGAPQGDAIATAVRAAREVLPELVIRARVAHRDPAEVLLDSARDRLLLVLGPGSLEPTRSPIGSVLHDVLLNVNAPVLVARPIGDRELVGPVAGAGAAS